MTDKNEVNAVCKELDELAVRMLDLMKQYIDLKLTMEDLIKAGSLHLAKSRYIMGNKNVSVLQLPTEDSELKAFAKVLRSDEDDDELRLELSRMSLSPPSPVDVPANSRVDEDGLKRRKGKGNHETQDKGPTPSKDEKDDKEKNVKKKDVMQDPLKWFGVLVPQNLRLAQSSFNKAVETSVEIANVQLEMDSIRQKYDSLVVKKKNLANKSSEVEKS